LSLAVDIANACRYYTGNPTGVPYGYWGGGALELHHPMWMQDGYPALEVWSWDVNCSGLMNRGREDALGPGAFKAGTQGYADWISPWENYDYYKDYPVGTLLIEPFISGVSEGHIGIISTPDQYMLQSCSYYGGAYPGVIEWKTHREQNEYTPWAWAGFMPDALPDEYTGSPTKPPVTPGPVKATAFTAQHLLACMPNNLSQEDAQRYLPYLVQMFRKYDINTKLRIAGYLAQVATETHELDWWQELDSADGSYLRNQPYYPYYGRGPIQLTWDYNYRSYADDSGNDVVNNPDLLTEPEVGFDSSGWYWQRADCNSYCDAQDIEGLSVAVNGGYNGYQSRVDYWNWNLQQLPEDLTLDPPEPGQEERLPMEKYSMVVAPNSPYDKAFAWSLGAALAEQNVGATVFSGPDMQIVAAAALGANYLQLSCLVIGDTAAQMLTEEQRAHIGWSDGNNLWQCFDVADKSHTATHEILVKAVLPWIAEYEKLDKDKLVNEFNQFFEVFDLDLIDPPPPPPPPDTTPKTLEERVDILEREVAELRKAR
jgi:putative chitinase